MINLNKPARLSSLLICLTVIAVAAQISIFLIHYKVSDLVDSFVQSSLSSHMLHKVILLPLITFFSIQIASYAFFILYVWFITRACADHLQLSKQKENYLGIGLWFITCFAILALNNNYYNESFFAKAPFFSYFHLNTIILIVSATILFFATWIAYYQFFYQHKNRLPAYIFLILVGASLAITLYDKSHTHLIQHNHPHDKPNVIIIGLDSLRPDFVHFFGNNNIHTPQVDAFLQSATTFTNAYTPLARTFPAWVTILTAKYPKHSQARSNLADPALIIPNDNLAKRLTAAGYETTYGTDEKRFSNITNEYGFNHIIGPAMGVNDFLLGSLSDFPLTNLLINTPLGQHLFPFNYGNRAATITYDPKSFLRLVQLELLKRNINKPQFIAIHLCLSHWPYTWAHDKQTDQFTLAQRYASSVEGVDRQFGDLLTLLKNNGLLNNAIIILLSDHGTTVGLPHDRLISEDNYYGDKNNLNLITKFKLGTTQSNSLDIKNDFTMNTSYGQASDILSLKQYHVLLAFKGFGTSRPVPSPTSLFDVAPTILDYLHLSPLTQIDGQSLMPQINHADTTHSLRPLFLETGYTISEIETNDILVNKVLNKTIGAYELDPRTGLIYMKSAVEKSIVQNKQRAVLLGDWLLARYPASTRLKIQLKPNTTPNNTFQHITIAPYFVLVNVKTGEWTIGLSDHYARKAPLRELLAQFYGFYGQEI